VLDTPMFSGCVAMFALQLVGIGVSFLSRGVQGYKYDDEYTYLLVGKVPYGVLGNLLTTSFKLPILEDLMLLEKMSQ
jgi:hypothetical protein